MRHIEWSDDARSDLRDAFAYLADVDHTAAAKLRRRIHEAIQKLSSFPTGRPGRVSTLFEKPVSNTRFTICYRLSDDVLWVVRIVHQSRDWPEDGWPAD